MPLMSGWLYRKLGSRFFALWIAFEAFTAITITFATVALFSLYEDMSTALFWELVLVAEAAVVVALIYTAVRTKHLAAPVVNWVKGRTRSRRCARGVAPGGVAATRGGGPQRAAPVHHRLRSGCRRLHGPARAALVQRRDHLRRRRWWRWPTRRCSSSSPRSCSCGPWWRTSTTQLPPDWAGQPAGVPLRWKLLGALPADQRDHRGRGERAVDHRRPPRCGTWG